MRHTLRALIGVTWLCVPITRLAAQGVTTAAIQGIVLAADGGPVDRATVRVTNTSDGRSWEVRTSAQGRYFLEQVAVGGPYVIGVRAIGFVGASRGGVILTLGQRHVADFTLAPTAVELEGITVTAEADPLINPGRTGPAQVVSESTIARLPNRSRNFTPFNLTSPQVNFAPTGGISMAGQNDFFNGVQIDGGVNNDLYFAGSPGQGVLPHIISVDAVDQVQILIAPFDVRHGSFTGGLFNAVTKSGTNTTRGAVFAFFENQGLVGPGPSANPAPDFTTWRFGGSLGGPVVRDRAHYLVSLDVQRLARPDLVPPITDTAGGSDILRYGISAVSARRFQQILAGTYRLAPGALSASNGRNPTTDLFGKATAQIGRSSQAELSYHYEHGVAQGQPWRERGYYELTSTVDRYRASAHTARMIVNTVIGGRAANELIVGYLRLRDACQPFGDYPRMEVAADGGNLAAGADPACGTSIVNQDALELTDDLTLNAGRHLVTVGTHNEILHFRDPFLLQAGGYWKFDSLDSLEQGIASYYERGVPGPLRPEGPVADFDVLQLGLYAQDRWLPTPRLSVTAGLRLDVPFLPDAAVTNQMLETALGFDTGRLPGGNPLWSPRLGVSYDVRGDASTFLRGGVGLFSGRPPYRWITNGYKGSGGEEAILVCEGTDVPSFDPMNQPSTCATGPTVIPRITVFDSNVHFPQNLKLALGVDHRLPWELVATVDALYTQGTRQFYYDDANLGDPIGAAAGEAGRPLYGAIDSAGRATPTRRDAAFGQVVRVSNRSGDKAFSVTAQLQRRWGGGVELNGSYTFARSQDRMSLIDIGPVSNLSQTLLEGTLDDRSLATSTFETRHRLWLSGAVSLPWGIDLSLTYLGFSGAPFTYAVWGDANADGIGQAFAPGLLNDVVYVPQDPRPGGDVSLVVQDTAGNFVPAPASDYDRLSAFIHAESCLRHQRGRLLQRNSCLNAWVTFTTARIAKSVRTFGRQSLAIEASVFNLLNLINDEWGRVRGTTDQPAVPLLRLRGYDQVSGRGVYELLSPRRNVTAEGLSRWRMTVGVRYAL